MTADKLGRGFEALPIEEQVQALRDHAITQESLIKILLGAVEKLGVTFTKSGVPIGETDNDEPGLATEQIIKSTLARHRVRIVDFRSAPGGSDQE